MSIASQDVYLNLTTPISVIGSGSNPAPLPAVASFSTIFIAAPVGTNYDEGLVLQNAVGGNDAAQILFNAGSATPPLTMYYDALTNSVAVKQYSAGIVPPLLPASFRAAALVAVSSISGVPVFTLAQYNALSTLAG